MAQRHNKMKLTKPASSPKPKPPKQQQQNPKTRRRAAKGPLTQTRQPHDPHPGSGKTHDPYPLPLYKQPKRLTAIPVASQNAVRELKEEVRALLTQTMEPSVAHVVRMNLPGEVVTLGTAVAKTVDTTRISWPQALTGENPNEHSAPTMSRVSQTVPIIDTNLDLPVVLLRDPFVRAIVRVETEPSYIHGPSTATCSYQATFSWVGSNALQGGDCIFYVTEDSPQELPLFGLHHAFGYPLYGDFHTSGDIRGKRVVWIDAALDVNEDPVIINNALVAATMTLHAPDNTAQDLKLSAWRVTETSIQEEWSSNFSSISGDILFGAEIRIPESGYYFFEVGFDNTVDGETICPASFTMNIETYTNSGYRHILNSDILSKEGLVDEMRVLGASALMSNVTPTLYRGGTVTMAQVSGNRGWYNYFHTVAELTTLNPALRETIPWDKGAFCFVKPQGKTPFALEPAYQNLSNFSGVDGSTPSALPGFQPFREAGMVLVRISPPPATDGDVTIRTVSLTTASSFEFTTRDQYYSVDTTTISHTAHDEYVAALRPVRQFYENKFHLADIGRYIKEAAGKLVEWAPAVASGIGTAAQMASLIL